MTFSIKDDDRERIRSKSEQFNREQRLFGHRPGMAPGTTEEKELRGEHGFAGEYAASIFFSDPIREIYRSSDRALGDLESGIEIKSAAIRYPGMPGVDLLVHERETFGFRPDAAMVPLVFVLTPLYPDRVFIVGWIWGHEVLSFPIQTAGLNRASYRVPFDRLRDPKALWDSWYREDWPKLTSLPPPPLPLRPF